jgi:hypothetical protein
MPEAKKILHDLHVKLYINHLPGVEGVYIARTVRSEEMLGVRQVCASAKERGKFTGNYEDMVNCVEVYHEECGYLVTDGFGIVNLLVAIRPTLSGTFNSPHDSLDGHYLGISSLATEAFLAKLAGITVIIDGIAEVDAAIYEVTDVASQLKNGHITRNGMLVVDGKNIKVEGAVDQPSIGVYFDDGGGDSVRIDANALGVNTAGKIVLLVPNLNAGTYHIRVVTQYSHGGTLLKEPRVITFEPDLIVT